MGHSSFIIVLRDLLSLNQ